MKPDAISPVEILLRDGAIWSNVSWAETIVCLQQAALKLQGNIRPSVPSERGKEKLIG